MIAKRRRLSVDDHVQGVISGDRAVLARTITLLESHHPRHRAMAHEVLTALLPRTGGARRVGITGVPGVGKSTFVEAMGLRLVEAGHSVAVLAIDPTSAVSGGSILGDKTRMQRLATEPAAFIRPSPSQGHLGGVHRRTRETLLVCEAAGFDVVLVETVGVGQSEAKVAEMVDTFLVLLLAGAGDELQGIKKGVLELADVLAVNKADGDNVIKAHRRARELERALHLVRHKLPFWDPKVLAASALTGEGLDEVWATVEAHREALVEHGQLEARRRAQRRTWLWSVVQEDLLRRLRSAPAVVDAVGGIEAQVLDGKLSVAGGADALLQAFFAERGAEGP